MKGTKESPGFRFLWLYLLLSAVFLVGILLLAPAARQQVHYMDKADMFEIVRNNTQIILDDIEKNDFTRTLALLCSSREEPDIEFSGNCVTFYCYGHGFASNTSYEGFYYTPWDGPAQLGGMDVSSLKQQGNELVWYEKDVNGGDNEYHTEKICDNFWYYRLVY